MSPPSVWAEKPFGKGIVTGKNGAFFAPVDWKIDVPASSNKPKKYGDYKGIKATDKGGLVLQRVSITLQFDKLAAGYNPMTDLIPGTLKALPQIFPGYLRVTPPGPGAPAYQHTMTYWEVWEVPKDNWMVPPGPDNLYGGKMSRDAMKLFDGNTYGAKLNANFHNDAFSSIAFPKALEGSCTISGDVYYVDGLTLRDVLLGRASLGNPNEFPAGRLPSKNAQNLTTGRPNVYDNLMKTMLADRQANGSVSAKVSHVIKVRWDTTELNGQTQVITNKTPFRSKE